MNLARLVVAQIFLQASLAGMKMTVPLFALNHGFNAGVAGAVVAVFAASQLMWALPAGRLSGRKGAWRIVRASTVVAALAVAAVAAWPSLAAMCLAACLVGAAMVVTLAAIQHHVGRGAAGPQQLRRSFGWLSTASAAASFLGPLLAGGLIDRMGGYRAALAAMALLPLVSLIALWPMQGQDTAAAPQKRWSGWVKLAHDASFRRLMLVNCLLSCCWDVHAFAVPVLAVDRGISASMTGVILGSFSAAVAAVRLAVPAVASHLQERSVLVFALLAAVVLFGVYPLTSSAAGMCACSVLLGLTLGMEQPMVMSLLHQVTPAALQGEAIGMRLLVNGGSSALAPLLMGAASGALGLAWVLWGFGGLLALGARAARRLGATAPAG